MQDVPPSVLRIRYHIQQRQKLETMGSQRAATEHAQEHMVMAGKTKINIMEGTETSDYGVVRTGRYHVSTPRSLVHITPQKAAMVPGYEGTGNMAPEKQQMDTA
jgi:hypothetical protein